MVRGWAEEVGERESCRVRGQCRPGGLSFLRLGLGGSRRGLGLRGLGGSP